MSLVLPREAALAPRRLTAELRVSVVDSVADAAEAFARLEAEGAAPSAYQSWRFLEAWTTHVAPTVGVTPRIGVVRDAAGDPVALLPFGETRRGLLRSIVFLGGRDSNLNLPILSPRFAPTRAQMRDILARYAAALPARANLIMLTNQPAVWRGVENPLAAIGGRPSPSDAHGATIGPDAEAFLREADSKSTRKKLRAKAAKLEAIGAVVVSRQTDPAGRREAVTTLIAQKTRAFARRGVEADMDKPHVAAFLGALAQGAEPALDLYVMRVGARIAAVYGGLPHGRAWHALVNSYDIDPQIARCSPGDLLLRHVVQDLGRRGITSFDLGVGEARYKDALCGETIRLVDTMVPLTLRGRGIAAMEAARLDAKRRIKQTPWAYAAIQRLRAKGAAEA